MVGVIIKQPVLPLLVTKVTPERSLEKRTGVWERERTREREKTMCVYIYIYIHTQRRTEKGKARENHTLVPDVATLRRKSALCRTLLSVQP